MRHHRAVEVPNPSLDLQELPSGIQTIQKTLE